MVASCSVREALDKYHVVQVTDEDGKELTEVANKYYIMYGDMARTTQSVDDLRFGTEITCLSHSVSPSFSILPLPQLGGVSVHHGNQIPRWCVGTGCSMRKK